MSTPDKNCLSYWFPKLEAAGVPVPRTKIVEMPEGARQQFGDAMDGNGGQSSAVHSFVDTIVRECHAMGFPCFLRTGHTSHKHDWKRTCFVENDKLMLDRIYRLIEFSECADILGLPWITWAVREMLPTKPLAILPKYGDFPLVKEVRVFIGKGKVKCWHPYWPADAIRQGGCDDENVIKAVLSADTFVNKYESPLGDHWYAIAANVAEAFRDDEDFSVDLIPTKSIVIDSEEHDCGWYVTDMALAHRSYHWESCPVNK